MTFTHAEEPQRPRGRRAGRRLLLAALTATLATLAPAAAAFADSASLSFTDAAGRSDPTVDVGRTLTLTGTSAVSSHVWVRFRPAGGAPCAPSASSDSGNYSFDGFSGDTFNGSTVNGNFTLQKTGSWPTPGTFAFCIWIAASESTPATPFTQNVTFRSPTGTISATVAPITPQAGQVATVTIAGSSEAPKRVYAKIRTAGGAPCATSSSADAGRTLVDGTTVNGAFTLQATSTQSNPGNYLVCLWLADSSSDGSPVAGPQPALFSVTAPCVVPAAARFTALASYIGQLNAANCVAGAQRYTASSTFPRGTIVRVTPAAGTALAPRAAVALLISSGRPCRVPRVLSGMSVSTARSRLRAAGCVPGSIRRVSSRRRRGTVVSFSRSAGTRLSPRTIVGIRVSRGR